MDFPILTTNTAMAATRFGGKKTNKEVIQLLKANGVTPQSVADQWQVKLWTVKHSPNKEETKFKLDTSQNPDFNEGKFVAWLQSKVGNALGDIEIKDKPETHCCHHKCSGCITGNGNIRQEWLG